MLLPKPLVPPNFSLGFLVSVCYHTRVQIIYSNMRARQRSFLINHHTRSSTQLLGYTTFHLLIINNKDHCWQGAAVITSISSTIFNLRPSIVYDAVFRASD